MPDVGVGQLEPGLSLDEGESESEPERGVHVVLQGQWSGGGNLLH